MDFTDFTGKALRDLELIRKHSQRRQELEDIEKAFLNLKSYRSDLDKRIKSNKFNEKDLVLAKKLLAEVDSCMRIPNERAKLHEVEDYIDKVKRMIKR